MVMSTQPIAHLFLHEVSGTTAKRLMTNLYQDALTALQAEDDFYAYGLLLAAFEIKTVGVYDDYARYHHWSSHSIRVAEVAEMEKRDELFWLLVSDAFKLARSINDCSDTTIVDKLVEMTYLFAHEIRRICIKAGDDASPRLLPAPKPSQKRPP